MKSLVWKAQRLTKTNPVELSVRAGRGARNLLRHALLSAGLHSETYDVDFSTATETSDSRSAAKFFLDDKDDALRQFLSPFSAAYEAEAEEILSHRVHVLGHAYELGDSIDWHRDYRLGRKCPLRYSALIDLKDPEFEESYRWVSYFNRHRHLASLGRAYFVSRKREYAQEVVKQLLAWIDQNPPLVGVNWVDSFEIALRLSSWVWALFPLKDFEGFAPDTQKRIVGSIAFQTRHMFGNLSTHSSANNHLIGQANTLLVLGTLFPGLSGSRAWRAKGEEVLWRELLRQSFSDGVSKEQSVHYHAFVLEMFVIALFFAKRHGMTISPAVTERFSRMCDFLFTMCSAGSSMPAVGDSDDQTVLFPEEPARLLQGLAACAAYLLENEQLASIVKEVPLEAAVLLGRQGLEYVRACPRGAGEGHSPLAQTSSRAFPEGGYYILSDELSGGSITCIMDCGELGLEKTAAHGHADCLSVMLRFREEYVLIDPGTFTYHSQPEWRSYFRSTAAHNTISIDGASQSQMQGPFVWGRKARPRLHDVAMENCFDLVDASHDGYSTPSDPVTHRRAVVFVKPDCFIIVDLLSARKQHRYERNFHLGGRSVFSSNTSSLRVSVDDVQVFVFSPPAGEGEVVLVEGQRKPILGWNSPKFWKKQPSQCLSQRGNFVGDVLLETCVVVEPEGAPRTLVSFSESSREGRLYSVARRQCAQFCETALVNMGVGVQGEADLQSDASFLCLREFHVERRTEIFGRNVSSILSKGEPLLESTKKLAYVRIEIEGDTLRFESRGGGTVSVRTREARNVVSSLSGMEYHRKGEYLTILVDT